MAPIRPKAAGAVSPFIIAVGSLVIVVHLGAVAVRALAAPSGPWPGMGPGPDGVFAPPPEFAQAVDEGVARGYLNLIRLGHNELSPNSRPNVPGVFLEIRLKDAQGKVLTTVRLPDPQANPWVRRRQERFVQELVPDLPIEPPPGEHVPARGQDVRTVPIWDIVGERSLRLKEPAEHLIPRNRPVWGPTEWSLVLARSYARSLCRQHGAAYAEVLRHSRNPIPVGAFLVGGPPPTEFEDLVASYGDVSDE